MRWYLGWRAKETERDTDSGNVGHSDTTRTTEKQGHVRERGYKLDGSYVVGDLGFNTVRDILQEIGCARAEFSVFFPEH